MSKSILLFFVTVCALTNSNLFAQLPFSVAAGPRFGTTVKNNNFLAGGQVELGVAAFTLVPSFEEVFAKHVNEYQINIDGQYEVFGAGIAKMFFGGGVVVNSLKPDGGSRASDKGFDIQVGGRAKFSSLHIFGLVRFVRINGNNDEALVFGVNYGI